MKIGKLYLQSIKYFFKPVPLGLGEVKRDLSLCHGTSHIPTMENIPCDMAQALYHNGSCTCSTCANLYQKVGLQDRALVPVVYPSAKIHSCILLSSSPLSPLMNPKSPSHPDTRTTHVSSIQDYICDSFTGRLPNRRSQ